MRLGFSSLMLALVTLAAPALSGPAFLRGAFSARAQQIEVRPDEVNIIVPQRRVIAPRPGVPGGVELTAVDTSVKIAEQVAVTEMRFTLRNPNSVLAESQMLMPVPDGAVVRHFQLEGLGEEGIAMILPRDEARRIYDSIVRRSLDPGLLEFAGYNLIRSSVFPVPARGEQKVVLTYEQALPADGNRVDYVLPRSESLDATGIRWSFGLEIKSKSPISTVYSPSHDLVTERVSDSHVRVSVPTSSALNDVGAFRLSYLVTPGDALTASFVAYPDASGENGGGYFMLLLGLPVEENRPAVKREVTIVLDRSGSMRGEKMEQALESALQVIEGLREGEYFNIIDYSTDVEKFAEAPVEKTKKSMQDAREYLKALKPNGGTNIHDALIEALRQPVSEGSLPMVLFLTDGLPTVGVRAEAAIRDAAMANNKHNRRVFTFGVGVDVNTPLLSHIARSSRATSTFVLPAEDVEVKVGQVFKRLSGPVLALPTIEAMDKSGKRDTRAVRELMPGVMSDVFEGDQVVLFGRYTDDEPLKLRLSGEYYGKEKAFEFSFTKDKATTRNSFVPRLWASRKIGALIEEVRAMGANATVGGAQTDDPRFKELVDEIVTLSTTWGILTEYTAFLAIEPGAIDEMATRLGGFERMRSDRRSLEETLVLRSAAPAAVAEGLQRRAQNERQGAAGVNQELNLKDMYESSKLNMKNEVVNAQLERVELDFVRQVNDKSFYRRSNRWVDALALQDAEKPADETVEFGTDRFYELLDTLVKSNRQGVLALGGEVYLVQDSKRILVKLPTGEQR